MCFQLEQTHLELTQLALINSKTVYSYFPTVLHPPMEAVEEKSHAIVLLFSVPRPKQQCDNLSTSVWRLHFPSKLHLAALGFPNVVVLVVGLLVESVQRRLGLLPVFDGAVGDGVGHDAELAQEDLPEEQVDPRVQDLVEGGQADHYQKEVAVQVDVTAHGVIGGHRCGAAFFGGDLGGDHLQHENLRRTRRGRLRSRHMRSKYFSREDFLKVT